MLSFTGAAQNSQQAAEEASKQAQSKTCSFDRGSL